MCGIVGLIYHNEEKKVDHKLIESMTRCLAHRGPDAEGFFVQGPVALGHRRLKIIDLSTGDQPLFNEDGSIVVVFNGEIYNFQTLKTELEAKGHQFKTHSDTEVIVHAYEEYGMDCVNKFRGMFAFALYNTKSGEVFMGRDRVGKKPFYYFIDGERFLFASEVKSILKMLPERSGVNRRMIDFYMSLGYVPGEETLFLGIKKLLPGHWMRLQKGRIETQRYWDIANLHPVSFSFHQTQEIFEAILMESVRLRLISDVPLGAFLSGGVDSSSIVACMSRLSHEPVKTFTVGYSDDPASSELGFARVVASHFKTEHHEFILNSNDFFQSMEILLEHAEEPLVESAAVALFHLSQLARQHVTVLLSGEGGDEVLSGYPLHFITKMLNRVHPFASLAPGALVKLWVGDNEKRKKYWDWIRTPFHERYQSISNDVTDSIRRDMYAEELFQETGHAVRDYFMVLLDQYKGQNLLGQMGYVDILTWLPDDLLLKADKMTMATAVELRVPFLDHKLIEFCLTLPDEFKLHGRQGKYLLKKSIEKYLPRGIVYRKKRGFPVPIAKWFRENLYEKTRDILLDPRSLARGYFRLGYIEKVLQKHRNGQEDLSRRIFSLLALELWHQKYIDSQ